MYYCEHCVKEDRFIHPKSLMTLRETWIVFAACWVYAANMPKVLLPLIQEHFRMCWKRDVVVEDLSEDMFVPDCYDIDDYEFEYVDDDSEEANAMFPIHQVNDIEVSLEN